MRNLQKLYILSILGSDGDIPWCLSRLQPNLFAGAVDSIEVLYHVVIRSIVRCLD
jgi:hypothetical protein